MDSKPAEPLGPLRGYVFKVLQPDGTLQNVTFHVKSDGVVHCVMNGRALAPLIEAEERSRHTLEQPITGPQTIPGVIRTKDSNGNVSVLPLITNKAKRDLQLFVETIPCWFEGCQELRDAYLKDVETEQKKPGCKSCFKGAIMQKYLKLMANMNTEPKPE